MKDKDIGMNVDWKESANRSMVLYYKSYRHFLFCLFRKFYLKGLMFQRMFQISNSYYFIKLDDNRNA